ncbi:MAG: hypothetical protein D6702_07785 [Planctomycetota bacterium]|nr:MAG: hypothetical protein D6702_07785 [Planctomycetota bacterium]
MIRTRRFRLSLLLSAAVAASAWFPFPVPAGLSDSLLGGLELDGRPLTGSMREARFRWGTGSLIVRGLELRSPDRLLLAVDRADLRLDLRPWSTTRFRPRRVAASGVFLGLRPEDLERLRGGTGGPPDLAPLILAVEDARAELPLADGRTLRAELPEASGLLSRHRTRLRGRLVSPYGLTAEFRFAADHGFADWTLDLSCDDRDLRDRGHLPIAASAQAASCRLRARIRPDDLIADLDLGGFRLALTDPPLEVRIPRFRARGRLGAGLDLAAQVLAGPLAATVGGWLRRGADGRLELRLEGASDGPWKIDDDLRVWLQRLDPTTAEVFAALGLEGAPEVRLALDWRSGEPLRPVAHAAFREVRATYRGFLEADGDRPSFDYPAEAMRGDFVAAGPRFLVRAAGRAGDGTVGGWATVRVGPGPAEIVADLHGSAIPIDPRITRAVTGTPELSRVWRELGGPSGGTADFELMLRRPFGVRDVGLLLRARAEGVGLRPNFLPLPARAERVELEWSPGRAAFLGQASVLGGRVALQGRLQAVAGHELPRIEIQARSETALEPDEAARRVLEGFLDLPEGFAQAGAEGPAQVEASFLRDGNGRLSARIDWLGAGADLSWAPTGTRWEGVRGRIVVVRADRTTLVAAPRLEATCCGGASLASFTVAAGDPVLPPPTGLVRLRDLGVAPSTEAFARRILGLAPDTARDWTGSLDLALAFDPLRPSRNRGWVEFHPLSVRLQDEEAGSRPLVDLRGRLRIEDSTVPAGELEAVLPEGGGRLRRIGIVPDPSGTLVDLVVDTEPIPLQPDLITGLSPGAWAAFERVGLRGRAAARNLRLRLFLGDEISFALAGGLLLDRIAVEAAPRLRDGRARLEIEEFQWNGPEDWSGRMELADGGGILAGLTLGDASGDLVLTPKRARFDRFQASLLGGRVGTAPAADPAAGDGWLEFGLTPEAPLSYRVVLEDLRLARVREELGLGGDLAGRLSGELAFRSPTPSPLDYSGRGRLEVEGGALGNVPVLATMWRVAGIRPPVFDRGTIEFRADPVRSRGRIRIDRFELHHDLLEVNGKGWIGLDGYLDLKATVRTLSFLTRLPLVRDLVDLLVEQDVYGPIERPQVRQRALSKVSDPNPGRVPFPLWVPELEPTDWRLSPALPPVAPPAPPPENGPAPADAGAREN